MKNWLLTIYIFSMVLALSATQIHAMAGTPPLFQYDKPLELVLEADMISLMEDKSEEPEYSSAMLVHKLPNYQINAFQIKVKPRGNTRRLTELCDFPPLKFNFKKHELINTVFEGQDKLKFVSQCRQDDDFKNYLLEEYLLYKTYNVITENSYKTRLVNITIKDIKVRVPEIHMTGFLIEDDKPLAKRIEAKSYEKLVHNPDSCLEDAVDKLAMFQYMIGNTDWYINTNHNIDIFQDKANGSLIPVAFDFDFAGVINTPYAVPSKEIPIVQVRQRYFKGNCRDFEAYNPTIDLFNDKMEEIYALYNSFEYLPKHIIKKSLKYYTKFYKIINNQETIDESFYSACNPVLPFSSRLKN